MTSPEGPSGRPARSISVEVIDMDCQLLRILQERARTKSFWLGPITAGDDEGECDALPQSRLVGERGFEPPTSASRTLRANRAALLPEGGGQNSTEAICRGCVIPGFRSVSVPEEGLEPPTPALGRRRSIR